jgi:hypothetical protein
MSAKKSSSKPASGGCLEEFIDAGQSCEHAAAESMESCVRKTEALRRRMRANEAFFQHCIRTREEGPDDNERRGYGVTFDEFGHGNKLRLRWR